MNRAGICGGFHFCEIGSVTKATTTSTRARKPFSAEVRERAVRLVREQQDAYATEWAAIRSITEMIGCTGQTLLGDGASDRREVRIVPAVGAQTVYVRGIAVLYRAQPQPHTLHRPRPHHLTRHHPPPAPPRTAVPPTPGSSPSSHRATTFHS